MVPLALRIAGDLFIAIRKLTGSLEAAMIGALLMLVFTYGLWFGYSMYKRKPSSISLPAEVKSPGNT